MEDVLTTGRLTGGIGRPADGLRGQDGRNRRDRGPFHGAASAVSAGADLGFPILWSSPLRTVALNARPECRSRTSWPSRRRVSGRTRNKPPEDGLWTLLAAQGCFRRVWPSLSRSSPCICTRSAAFRWIWSGAGLSLVLGVSALAQAWGGELADTLGNKPVMVGALFLRTICVGPWLGRSRTAGVSRLGGPSRGRRLFRTLLRPALRSWLAEGTAARDRVDAYARLRVVVQRGLGDRTRDRGPDGRAVLHQAFRRQRRGLRGVPDRRLGNSRRGPRSPIRGFPSSPLVAAARDRRYLEFCAYGVIIAAVMAQLVVSLSVHSVSFAGLTEREVGLLFTVNALVVVATQTAITGRLRRSRITNALAVGSLFTRWDSGRWDLPGFAAMALAVVVVSIGEVVVSPG